MKNVIKTLAAIALLATVTASIAMPVTVYPYSQRVYGVEIYPGSLKGNIQRLADQYGWPQVIWNVPNDYHWIGYVRVAGNNLPDILRNILANYPLQANFYQGNHVLVIQPRTLQ